MEPDRSLTRFFLVLAGLLGLLAAGASLALHTWWPLAALGLVLLGVAAISLSEAAVFAPLLALILRAGERKPGAGQRGSDACAKRASRRPREDHNLSTARHTRSSSDAPQACAPQPRNACGASPSRISGTCPMQPPSITTDADPSSASAMSRASRP